MRQERSSSEIAATRYMRRGGDLVEAIAESLYVQSIYEQHGVSEIP